MYICIYRYVYPQIMENQMDKKWKIKSKLGLYRDLQGLDTKINGWMDR